MRKSSVIIVLVVAAVAAAPLGSSEGRIPVWMPTTITQPGHYILTRNVLAATGPVINIAAGGVTLDLNGHTVGTTDTTQAVIQIGGAPGGAEGIIVIDGIVEGGRYGIVHPDVPDATNAISLSNLTLIGSADAAVKGIGISKLEAQGIIIVNSRVGFDLQAETPPDPVPPTARIRNVSIRAAGGIHCEGVVCSIHDLGFEYTPPSAVPRTPALRFSGAKGGEAVGIIVVDGAPSPIDPPLVELLDAEGITLSGAKLIGPGSGIVPCTVVDSTSRDFIIDDGDISRCGGDGIRILGTNGRIRRMFISATGGHGIFAGGSNLIIDDGKIAGSTGAGIWFDRPGHIYRNNILRGNMGGAVAGPGVAGTTDAGGNVE